MHKLSLSLAVSLVLTFSTSASSALALQSAPITKDSKVVWSQVVKDPFDGTVVYDKHYTDDFIFVSRWSTSGIRATYTQRQRILTGYQTQWVDQWVPNSHCDHAKKHDCKHRQRRERYAIQEPVFQEVRRDRVPKKILFTIANKSYTYESGPVSPELAIALSSAADENLRIRLEWENGETTDMEIGKGTVKAWKTLFQLQK